MNNIPNDIKDSPSKSLNFPPEFDQKKMIEDYMAEQEGRKPDEPPVPEETRRTEIAPDLGYTNKTPAEMLATEALVDDRDPDISEDEKALFLKALLHDEPIRLTIPLCRGQFVVQLRSRYTHEQRLVFDMLRDDLETGSLPPNDVNLYVNTMQRYFMGLMVERVNDEIFSDLIVPKTEDSKAAALKLREVVQRKCEMSNIRWTTLINAMRIFEAKCAKLNTMAANEDFWVPRG